MKEAEFFFKAQTDPSFRQQKLEEARYHRRLSLGFAVVLTAGWLGYVAYCGIVQSRWPGDCGLTLALVLCVSLYSQAGARLGALQAMQSGEPNPPNRGGSSAASGEKTWTTP